MSDGNQPMKGVPQMRMFRLPDPDPKDPRAICPWCGARIAQVDMRFDPLPVATGTVLITLRCKNCQILHSQQIVPAEWVVEQSAIDLGGGDLHKVLSDLRKKQGEG